MIWFCINNFFVPWSNSPWIKAANLNSIEQCPVLLPKQCRGVVSSSAAVGVHQKDF